MLDAEHNFARPVPGGKEVATVASVKPRSKPAGDTTCKTDTRVWPRRTSNKLQWADVFCKLHTSYVSSIHTSCMAPRLGYDPWPLVHRLRLRMPHELQSQNSDDSMALAYADHSVARKHLCADQNVARTRCEYTQLQGCIVSMRAVC